MLFRSKNASEALEGYAESVIERDIKLPPASDVMKVRADNPNELVVPIYCDLKSYENSAKSVKKTLTIPQWLNEKAIKNNINFSETLQNALLERLYR